MRVRTAVGGKELCLPKDSKNTNAIGLFRIVKILDNFWRGPVLRWKNQRDLVSFIGSDCSCPILFWKNGVQ